jgi:predicted phosphodiesterase
MRVGVVADIHGNAAALDAVIADSARLSIDYWWALGDLVLFGPRPVEVLDALTGLGNVAYVSGNTDRYVTAGEQPAPHATAAEAAGDVGLVERYGAMAGAIGWTRGALSQAGCLPFIAGLPAEQRVGLPDGSTLLGVHATPGRDDGPGIDRRIADRELYPLLRPGQAATIVGGHTHDPTDRTVGGIRALNPGSVGLPRHPGRAGWLVIDADESGIRAELRRSAFDIEAVVTDLHQRGYPNAGFLETVLAGAPWPMP